MQHDLEWSSRFSGLARCSESGQRPPRRPEIASWAAKLGDLAMGAGASGLVCSAMEVADLRARFPEATLVTPGIRPEGYGVKDDQTRVVTPAEALASGSTYLVIGRPIYRARDPLQAATEIARSL